MPIERSPQTHSQAQLVLQLYVTGADSGPNAAEAEPRTWGARLACVRSYTFSVIYEGAGEGWVYAHVPELPEVHTQGRSLEEARAMARAAIELVLADRRSSGEDIPATGWALVEPVEIAA